MTSKYRVSKGAVYREKQSRTVVRAENTQERHGKVYTWTKSIGENKKQKEQKMLQNTRI